MSGKSRFNVLCKDVPWDRTRELQNPRREEQDGMSTGLGTAVAGTRFCEPMYPCQCGPFSTLASSWLEPPRLALLSLHLRFRSPSEPGGVAHINTQLRRLQVQLLSRTGFCFVLFSSFLKKKKKKGYFMVSASLPVGTCPGWCKVAMAMCMTDLGSTPERV